jgi:hypothetical protein
MFTRSIRFHFTTFRATSRNHAVITSLCDELGYVVVPITLGQFGQFDAIRVGLLNTLYNVVQVAHVDV